MEIKLINTARGSLQELRADYNDYLKSHHLEIWAADNPRLQRLREFCRSHNDYSAYAPFIAKMNDEVMANTAITLLALFLGDFVQYEIRLENDQVIELNEYTKDTDSTRAVGENVFVDFNPRQVSLYKKDSQEVLSC